MPFDNFCSIYDFRLFPCSLSTVLRWNLLSAIRCVELGLKNTDLYICLENSGSENIFQESLGNSSSYILLFNELISALGTHPRLGNIYFYRSREEMLVRLREVSGSQTRFKSELDSYERALACRGIESLRTESPDNGRASSRACTNVFTGVYRRTTTLRPSPGCRPDVDGLLAKRFSGKRIVVVDLRRHSPKMEEFAGAPGQSPDSDTFEWYQFFEKARERRPDVQFIAVGRLQEIPSHLLTLSNLINLRTFGLGLGHELSLILSCDFFMGLPGGFASLACFSTIPYAIVGLNSTPNRDYQAEPEAQSPPISTERQILADGPVTRELLLEFLNRGIPLRHPNMAPRAPAFRDRIDVRSWEWERAQWLHPGATTSRYLTDNAYSDKETAYLVWPNLKRARTAYRSSSKDIAWSILQRIEYRFPRMCRRYPEFLRLKKRLAIEKMDKEALADCDEKIRTLTIQPQGFSSVACRLRDYWHWGYPGKLRARRIWAQILFVWERKHRIPGKMVQLSLRLVRQ